MNAFSNFRGVFLTGVATWLALGAGCAYTLEDGLPAPDPVDEVGATAAGLSSIDVSVCANQYSLPHTMCNYERYMTSAQDSIESAPYRDCVCENMSNTEWARAVRGCIDCMFFEYGDTSLWIETECYRAVGPSPSYWDISRLDYVAKWCALTPSWRESDCGDGACNGYEDQSNCYVDCGSNWGGGGEHENDLDGVDDATVDCI